MKTQIIQLDQFDDVVSARDKLLWSKSPRILLVFPSGSSGTFSLIDLMLLFRQAQQQGAQIAFVVSNKEMSSHLDRLGVPNFLSIRDANNRRWRTIRKQPAFGGERMRQEERVERIHNLKKNRKVSRQQPLLHRLPVFLTGIAAVLCLTAFFIPGASINFDTDLQPQSYNLELRGDPDVQTVQISGILPLYEASVTVFSSVENPATGQVLLPGSRAAGVVEITNLTTKAVQIPAGNIFTTAGSEPVRFINQRTAFVAAGVGETTQVEVEAVLPGVVGNTDAESIRAVEGGLGLSFSVTNPEAMKGGQQTSVPSPSEADFRLARTSLLSTLDSTALAELQASLAPGQVLVVSTMERTGIIDEQRNPLAGQPGQHFQLAVEAEYQAWYFEEEDVRLLARAVLDATLPPGFQPENETIDIRYIQQPAGANGQVVWEVSVERMIEKKPDLEDLIRLVAGKDPQVAAQVIMNNYQMETEPRIEMMPEWWPFLPFMAFQYEVSEQQ